MNSLNYIKKKSTMPYLKSIYENPKTFGDVQDQNVIMQESSIFQPNARTNYNVSNAKKNGEIKYTILSPKEFSNLSVNSAQLKEKYHAFFGKKSLPKNARNVTRILRKMEAAHT